MHRIQAVFTVLFLGSVFALAQNIDDSPVLNTFNDPLVITSQSCELTEKGTWDFVMQHRFGEVNWDEEPWKDLFGLDLSSNIRLGFSFPIGSKLNIGFGRSNYKKIFDAEVKYRLFQQTESGRIPLSIAIYASSNLQTSDFPSAGDEYYNSDSTTLFSYNFSHRLSYTTQIIASRRINRTFSVQVGLAISHKNLTEQAAVNSLFAIPMNVRVRTGFSSNLLIEYIWLSEKPENNLYPLSVAWEISSSTHNFQIVASSSKMLYPQEIFTSEQSDYSKGNFYLGFNIRKTFYLKKHYQ